MMVVRGDYGVLFSIQLREDRLFGGRPLQISGDDKPEAMIAFVKPDGKTVVKRTVSVAPDGFVQYTVEQGLLDQVGTWEVRIRGRLTNGAPFMCASVCFDVQDFPAANKEPNEQEIKLEGPFIISPFDEK